MFGLKFSKTAKPFISESSFGKYLSPSSLLTHKFLCIMFRPVKSTRQRECESMECEERKKLKIAERNSENALVKQVIRDLVRLRRVEARHMP